MNNESKEKSLEELIENWELYIKIISTKVENEELKKSLLTFCEQQSQRILICPASTRTDFIAAAPGGLVWHSLNVLKLSKDLNKVYSTNISVDDLITTSLFHDIGKIGDQYNDLYIKQESNWHRERGMMFELNTKLNTSTVSQRTLWWLNHYKVPLNLEVINAITSFNQDPSDTVATHINYNVPNLTLILQQAIRAACILNKGKF
jgi:hypothetical protein